MKNLMQLSALFDVTKASEESDTLTISGYANTTSKDRHGDVVLMEAWTKGGLDNYLKNPIILAYHNQEKPVGKMISYYVDDRGFSITAEISKAADSVYSLIKDGILKTFSIGFSIKDAKYDPHEDTFYIKDLELYEVSVVSVPANQDSIFSVKSATSPEELEELKAKFIPATEANNLTQPVPAVDTKENNMTDNTNTTQPSVVQVELTGVEKLLATVEARFAAEKEDTKRILDDLRSEIKEKAAEIEALQKSKMKFDDRSTSEAISIEEKEKAVLLAKCLNRPINETKYFASITKSTHVPSADWENTVSTRMFDDIRHTLVVEPLFTRIDMPTPTMQMLVNPETGYGQWIAASAYADAATVTTASTGTLQNHALTETTLTAYKLAAKEALTYEEEEDAILPLLPLVRAAIVRRMAKSSDKALLLGTATAGTDPITGLAKRANDASANTTLAVANKITVAHLAAVRRKLGAWGINPADVTFIISTEAYYDLLDDADFRTVQYVGPNNATILTGEIGFANGSKILVSGEFEAKAATKTAVIAVNRSNFVVGEHRSLMVERDKNIEYQRNIIVATRRMGFIPGVAGYGVAALNWTA